MPFMIFGVLLFFLSAYCLFSWSKRPKCNPTEQVFRVLGSPGQDHLRMRAEANTRLVHVFQLKNTFVTDREDVHREFVADARSLLQGWDETTFPGTAHLILDDLSTHLSSNMNFACLIQIATFLLITDTFLNGCVPPSEWRAVLEVTHGINDLWEASKATSHLHAAMVHQLTQMNEHLRLWLPHLERQLDFVIPTYETMWRVVAVLVARAEAAPEMARTLCEYFDDPRDKSRFHTFHESDGSTPSVEAFVKEVLRLHSPVKRISRSQLPSRLFRTFCAVLPHWLKPASVYTADLDALHRDPNIWGQSVQDFDASRFHATRLTREQNAAWLPFGHGPLKCVAAGEAPRLAALIAGAVIKRMIEGGSWKLQRGQTLGGRRGWEEWSVQISGPTTG